MMTSNDLHDDPVLEALRDLGPLDVDRQRAERLGARCRAVLATETRATAAAGQAGFARWTRATGFALLVAWCTIYTFEIVRRGAAVWGL